MIFNKLLGRYKLLNICSMVKSRNSIGSMFKFKNFKGNDLLNVERGSFHTSEVKLSERWKVDRKTVRKFLELLQKDNMISIEKSKKGTTIKISNYNTFQDFSTSEKDNTMDNGMDNTVPTQGTTHWTDKSHISPNTVDTNNNDKELYKNYKNEEEGKEGKEGKEKPPPPPSIPPLSDIQKTILNQFGDVTYKTWFLNAEIINSDKEVKFIVPNSFTRDIISDRFRGPLERILNRKVFIDVNS